MKLTDTEIDFPRLDVAIEAMRDSLEAIKTFIEMDLTSL